MATPAWHQPQPGSPGPGQRPLWPQPLHVVHVGKRAAHCALPVLGQVYELVAEPARKVPGGRVLVEELKALHVQFVHSGQPHLLLLGAYDLWDGRQG